MDILRLICSIFIPPLGVFLQVGIGLHFWLNIVLTLLGYFPGLIHAFYSASAYSDGSIMLLRPGPGMNMT